MPKTLYSYDKIVKELRHRYELKYEKVLDDEIIYLIVRMNELEVSLKEEIKKIKEPKASTKLELFVFGLGKVSIPIVLSIILALLLSLN